MTLTFLLTLILVCYFAAAAAAIAALESKRRGLFRVSTGAAIAGFALHTVAVVGGGIAEGHLPIYGAQEVCSFLGWALVLYFLIVQTRYPTNALASLLFPTATLLTAVSAFAPAIDQTPQSVAGAPVLFSLHAGLMLLAYAAFLMMFMAGVMYIVQEREIKEKRFGAIFYRLPSLDTCDTIGFSAFSVGFVLLTLGTVVGIIWSRLQFGVFWKTGPIEVFTIFTWLVYLALMHYRLTAGWRGRRAALVSIVGFCLIVFSLVVVRITGGFHAL
jgi:ABC-type transport system involved in cytochrome c biogenesis permease subunit